MLSLPMMELPRLIEPEWLDELPPADPRAQRSRQDLRRLNFIMGNVGILQRRLDQYWTFDRPRDDPIIIAELGAGDGTFMLALARRMSPKWASVKVFLVDRQPSVSEQTRLALQELDWAVECVTADVFDWLSGGDAGVDVMICNLFLHHFHPQPLAALLTMCAQRSTLFLACEPVRSRMALCGSHLLGVIGCNDVTRHDAILSVRAGFRQHELTDTWPDKHLWLLKEHSVGLFSHAFVAQLLQE